MQISKNPLILPPTVTPEQVVQEIQRRSSKAYECPNCEAETTQSKNSLDWVRCPIYNGSYICEGCCIDVASACRHEEWQSYPFKDLIDEVSHRVNRSTEETRAICIQHQIEILEGELREGRLSSEWKKVREQQLNTLRGL